MSPAALSFVTVVFEPEIPLLLLQARSLARYLDPNAVAEIIVLDNCGGGMGRHARRDLLDSLGPALAQRAKIVRTTDLGVDGGTQGWRSQQAAKLLVAHRIGTAHFVILDAKNHAIAPTGAADFVDAAGRARGGTHPYTTHPLRAALEHTLRYLDADDAVVESAIAGFPRTATPFVIDTAIARRMMDDVQGRSGRQFSEEFERAQLLEFFLYSGWSMLRGDGVPVNGDAIDAPIVWPGRATEHQVAEVVNAALETDANWFAVHRRALARADAVTRQRLASFWVDRDLMDAQESARFLRRFRAGYGPAMVRARLSERVSRIRRR